MVVFLENSCCKSQAHPNYKCDHEANRLKVCAPCGRKISFGNSKPSAFQITDKLEKLIQSHINKDYSLSNTKFPVGICCYCRLALCQRDRTEPPEKLKPFQKMPNYEDIQLVKETRNVKTCYCYICITGRNTTHNKIKKGKGHTLQLSNEINIDNGLIAAIVPAKIMQPPTDQNNNGPSSTTTICNNCLQKVGRGIAHSCSLQAARQNVVGLLETLPEKQQEQVIAQSLKKKMDSTKTAVEDIDSVRKNEITLSTLGSKLRICINPKEKKQNIFSHDSLSNFQLHTGVSSNHMKKMANLLRSNAGRKCIPPNFNQHMSETSKILENIYNESSALFDVDREKKDRPIIWADAQTALYTVIGKQNYDISDLQIKIMADSGQGFLKISMSIIPLSVSGDEKDFELDDKKRNTYKEGGTVGKKCVSTSVHRLILLCVVPGVKESYENLKILFDLISINNLSFKFLADFKLLLTVIGQQTASATYPCPYCFVTLADLRDISQLQSETNQSNEEELLTINARGWKLKTFGDLKEDHENYLKLGDKKKSAKDCHSTVNLPLFDEEDDTYVIEKCPIPELHVMQGFVNTLFWSGIVNCVGREKALIWPQKLGLVAKNYCGEIFEGNACRKLLQHADALLDPEIYEEVGELALIKFVTAFKEMDKLVTCCFSKKSIGSNVRDNLNRLFVAFKGIEMSETLKIHVLLDHLEHCLHFLGEDGLGKWSEQAGESVHRVFLRFWNKYKVNQIENPIYSIQLKKAVVEFSSQHI